MTEIGQRLPHVDVNMSLRALKARKIEILLGLEGTRKGGALLEVGTGSGGIAHYFASRSELNLKVSAVDVVDNRQLFDGYDFRVVEGVALPFDDASFDVVISNHVIEHVGTMESQVAHLRELWRVLKPGGIGYLAVPNRWMLVEPHYRLPFLSWLPPRWRSTYVRAMGKGKFYDCEPLSMPVLERLLSTAGVKGENIGVEAIATILAIERPDTYMQRVFSVIPRALLAMGNPLIPTLIYRLKR